MIEEIGPGPAVGYQPARAAPARVCAHGLAAQRYPGADFVLRHAVVALISDARDAAIGVGDDDKRRLIAFGAREQVIVAKLAVRLLDGLLDQLRHFRGVVGQFGG